MAKLELTIGKMEILRTVVHHHIQMCLGQEETVMNPKNIDEAAWLLSIYEKLLIAAPFSKNTQATINKTLLR